jgi:plastocyanin
MKKGLLLIFMMGLLAFNLSAQDHTVTVQNFSFSPANLTINVGESVLFDNISGLHNVNGTQATFPDNPESFTSGMVQTAPWQFTYIFNTPGVYEYRCDQHAATMSGTITVVGGGSDLVLTGIFDGGLSGGQPKGIELLVLNDIPDLSIYGVGSANNGEGSDGEEFTFPAVAATAGDHLYLADDSTSFMQYFGFFPDFGDSDGGSMGVNGDDAVELFLNGQVVDVFGDINLDGTGQPWEYLDGWAKRNDNTGPDGATFMIGNWTFSGIDAFDFADTNCEGNPPFPIAETAAEVMASDDDATAIFNTDVTIDVLENDFLPNCTGEVSITNDPSEGMLMDNGNGSYTYSPNQDFCGNDSFTYEVCDTDLNSCATATVNITVQCAADYPVYAIATVTTTTDGNPDSLGVTCQLQGIVHGIDLQPDNPIQFFFTDGTGGISVFSNDDFGYTVQEGDELIIQGTITEFNCLTQIAPDNITFVSADNPLDAPALISGPLTENEESALIRINNLTLEDPSDWDNSNPAGFNVDVTDGVNTYAMRIDNAVDLYNMAAPTGTFDAIGLGSQFDSDGTCDEGYQFLPRYMEDLLPVSNTTEASWANEVTLSPNPTTDWVELQTSLEFDQIELYNIYGKHLNSYLGNTRQLDLQALPQGVYLVRLTLDGEALTRQVVKQ